MFKRIFEVFNENVIKYNLIAIKVFEKRQKTTFFYIEDTTKVLNHMNSYAFFKNCKNQFKLICTIFTTLKGNFAY